jgi:soluble lytic murein transglycosylase-like protein
VSDPVFSSPLLAQLMEVERKAAFWRGFFTGMVFFGVVAFGILFFGVARAQDIPSDAFSYRRDLIRYGRNVWGMDAPTASFAAQIHQESLWRAGARSPVGAQGIAQFMPATARWIAVAYPSELGEMDALNPQWGMRALVRYDKHLYDSVEALNRCEKFAFALSAYNGGLGWVYRRKQTSVYPLVCLGATCEVNPGVSPASQRENAQYPRRILLSLEPLYVKAGFGIGVCS